MLKIIGYLTVAYHGFLFNQGYNILKKNPNDREILAITFEYGRRTLWALDDLDRKNKDLEEKVYALSKEIKQKGVTWEDAPYLFPEL